MRFLEPQHATWRLPPKFTDDERAAYQWLLDCNVRGWMVDMKTKHVHYFSGKLIFGYESLIHFARSKGMVPDAP